MERNTLLLQVIREMHSQIDKLERENRALREELYACGLSAAVGGQQEGDGQPALPHRKIGRIARSPSGSGRYCDVRV